MKTRILLFLWALFFAPSFVYGACSSANLTRCLDSVCAINMGANPAARCQYCGTASAGEPTKSTTMKNISAGLSTNYVVSDKELKKAPTDPGQRYVWGTKLCLEKVTECTPDDVEKIYDPLIEQSCKAAGISADMANLLKKLKSGKTQSACSTDIGSCIVDTKRCNADYRKCESDSEFDKYFSECSIASTGCDSFLSDIRKNLDSARKTSIANADKILKNIVAAYKNAREQKLTLAQSSCKNNQATKACVERICASNMRNKCAVGFEYENIIANELCKFYDIACERLR